jgi:hypothetical protein
MADTFNALKERGYARTKIIGSDGKARHSASNGDALARALLIYVAGGGDLTKLAKVNGLQDRISVETLSNQGLARMTLGNMLRALVKRGEPVTVGDLTVKSLDQKVMLPTTVNKVKGSKVRKATRADAA